MCEGIEQCHSEKKINDICLLNSFLRRVGHDHNAACSVHKGFQHHLYPTMPNNNMEQKRKRREAKEKKEVARTCYKEEKIQLKVEERHADRFYLTARYSIRKANVRM